MSAVRLKKHLPIVDKKQEVPAGVKKKIINTPTVQRAAQLYLLGRYEQGDAEWQNALDNMSNDEAYAAAKIAQKWGMTHYAIRSGEIVKHNNDIELMFPLKYEDSVKKHADENGIEPAWVYGIIRQESRFRPAAKSGVGARGLMQLMPATAKEVAKRNNLHVSTSAKGLENPETNITLGSTYMGHLLKTFNNHGILATASYNAGPGNVHKWLPKDHDMDVDQWVELIPFDETRGYVKKVFVNTAIYQKRLSEKKGIGNYVQPVPAKEQ